ncbi:MAG: type III pantothenate kinase [Bacillota bacterium]
MTLLLDIGNTRIKWARLDGGRLHGHDAALHLDDQLLKTLARAFDGPAPERVLACNVAGPLVGQALTNLCHERYRLQPEFLIPAAEQAGVKNGYTDPARLGADRWAALIGAFHIYGGPSCVIDAGTAITVDALAKRGMHLGGLIAPGPQSMRRALAGATAGLPDQGEGEFALFAKDTKSGITSGGWQAAAGLVERMHALLTKELGKETRFILTGGDAERLMKLVSMQVEHCPDLVLRGLAVVAGARP